MMNEELHLQLSDLQFEQATFWGIAALLFFWLMAATKAKARKSFIGGTPHFGEIFSSGTGMLVIMQMKYSLLSKV